MFKNKTFLISLFLLIVVLVLSACGNGDDNNASEDPDDSEQTTQSGDATNGEDIYDNNCMSCHGADGEGDSGPDLQTIDDDYDEVVDQVKNGGDGMPAFEDDLSEQEINDVAAFITEEIAS